MLMQALNCLLKSLNTLSPLYLLLLGTGKFSYIYVLAPELIQLSLDALTCVLEIESSRSDTERRKDVVLVMNHKIKGKTKERIIIN